MTRESVSAVNSTGDAAPRAPARESRGAADSWLAGLASLRLTLAFIVLLGASILGTYASGAPGAWPIALPLGLLAVNLTAAVLTNTAFRRQTALLVFHLALLSIVLLAALGRMTYLKGELELSTGEAFSGELTRSQRGPWHLSRLDRVAFVNDGYTIAYAAGVRRNETHNRVTWRDTGGESHASVIGDQQPLVLDGYRFYTSPNKGFAPVFTWRPHRAPASRGTIHLPAYPAHEYRQALEWTLPGTQTNLWVMLELDEVVLDPAQPSEFRLPSRHRLVVRMGPDRHELSPGRALETPHGLLVYEGLTTWMGYTVFYDWTMPWLLAACVLAVLALGCHFWRKFAARAWES